ncbi:MAG: ABC transporter substrate-binding protein, partial [Nitrososphaerales archaeon]
PYVVTQVVEDSYVKFAQNPTYWGDSLTPQQIKANPYLDPGHVKNVIIYAKSDDVSRYVDLSSGTAQIVPIQTQDWPLVTANPSKYGTLVLPPNADNIVALALNTLRYPTNVTAVREAIAFSINYTAVSDSAFLGTQGGGLSPMMGPTYPGQTQYYNLGNLPPYSYNVSKAKQILSNAGINPANLPTLEFRVIAGCGTCINTAQVVQADLSAIGISVNVEVTSPNEYAPPLVAGSGTYSQEVSEAQTVAQITWFGTGTFAPDEPTPADSWLTWVSNATSANNWAIYSNPTVQACVNGFTNGATQSQLISLCTAAQQQIYNDVPYVWLGSVRLWIGGGSLVYNKQVISGFLCDPVFSGSSEEPIFNTVTFVGQ